jgi:hypothetical protein
MILFLKDKKPFKVNKVFLFNFLLVLFSFSLTSFFLALLSISLILEDNREATIDTLYRNLFISLLGISKEYIL